jgi:hydroxymethylbilane synthase
VTGKPLRIGTRDSILATWQARFVQERLKRAGCPSELRFIKTEGDRVLDTPLPLMGGKGVFTKALDDALLAGEIDLAVHSLKDIPTRLPDGLVIGAVSEREDTADVLVTREAARAHLAGSAVSPGSTSQGGPVMPASSASTRIKTSGTVAPGTAGNQPGSADSDTSSPSSPEETIAWLHDPGYEAVIASSSNRRIGQWLARYPRHRMTDIRGNVQTRLRKLAESDWDGAIFAAAGLVRLGLYEVISTRLDWMLPAPAQGAMAVMIRAGDGSVREALACVHDPETALCTTIERDVLHTLEGGCSAPVGALATVAGGQVRLRVGTVYPDGTGFLSFDMSAPRDQASDLGKRAADEALRRGADALIRDLRGDGKRDHSGEEKSREAGMPGEKPSGQATRVHSAEQALRSAGSTGEKPSSRERLVISTRTVTSDEVTLARRLGIRLMDYPVWQYRWITPPPHLTATIMAEAPQAWVFTSRRGVEGWWRVWKEQMKRQRLRDEILGRTGDSEAGAGPGAEPGAAGQQSGSRSRPASIPRVYAVGETTAQAVRQFFGDAGIRTAGGGDGKSLGEDLAGDDVRSAVHFCAVERRPELAEVCMSRGISLIEAEVYERGPVPDPKPLMTSFDALLFFSPDGVYEFLRIYGERIQGEPEGSWKLVAVGQTTAGAIREQTGREPLTASTPSFEEMLKLV